MRKNRARDIMAEIKSKMILVKPEEHQSSKRPVDTSRGYNARMESKRKTSSYNPKSYLKKLENGNLDKFSTKDMMYFFRDTAQDNGAKYVIANPQKDMRQFKLLIERGYTVEEILSMIEFLFTSEQDYLSKASIHPGILVSTWCNTIYADTKLWLEDEYVPKSKKNKSPNREWKDTSNEDDIKVDDWGF